MSTICMTVHDLLVLLEASQEDHTCQDEGLPSVIVEDKTVDHYSAQFQLEPSELDLCHDDVEKRQDPGKKTA